MNERLNGCNYERNGRKQRMEIIFFEIKPTTHTAIDADCETTDVTLKSARQVGIHKCGKPILCLFRIVSNQQL